MAATDPVGPAPGFSRVRRGEQRGVSHAFPAAGRVERGVAQIGEAQEALGVAKFPEGARRVELDVAARGLELA